MPPHRWAVRPAWGCCTAGPPRRSRWRARRPSGWPCWWGSGGFRHTHRTIVAACGPWSEVALVDDGTVMRGVSGDDPTDGAHGYGVTAGDALAPEHLGREAG